MAIPYTDKEMHEMGFTNWRELPDGTILAVGPMLHNNGRLFVNINRYGYEDCYCYDSLELANKSMMEFNPEVDKEPEGWKRHPTTGRRRKNGDPSTEEIWR
jgi:hypothetical protein